MSLDNGEGMTESAALNGVYSHNRTGEILLGKKGERGYRGWMERMIRVCRLIRGNGGRYLLVNGSGRKKGYKVIYLIFFNKTVQAVSTNRSLS